MCISVLIDLLLVVPLKSLSIVVNGVAVYLIIIASGLGPMAFHCLPCCYF